MDPFVGEIRMFGAPWAPQGWALCQGQLLAISGNDALFSLLGTSYGGDGRTTFGLPDLRGRVPIHVSTTHAWGSKSGQETVPLTGNQNAAHNHPWKATNGAGENDNPVNAGFAKGTVNNFHAPPFVNVVDMNGGMVANAGSSAAHENMQPYQVINYIIALEGIQPTPDQMVFSPNDDSDTIPEPACDDQ